MLAPEAHRTPYPAAGALSFLRPALHAFHIPHETWERLTRAASLLAPVPRLALEIRLNKKNIEPDLHQLVLIDSGDAEIMAEFLRTAPADAPYPAPTYSLLQHWQTAEHSAGLGKPAPDHLYFEWDFALLDGSPSVFLPMDAPPPEQILERLTEGSVRDKRMQDLEAFAGKALGKNVGAIRDTGKGGPSVSHAGAMTSRGELLRVNYRGVRAGELVALLEEISWPGKPAAVEALFRQLLEIADKVTVAVTFSEGSALDGIGFEILFEEAPRFEPRWKRLFSLLFDLGCCCQDEADCLLALNRRFYPYEKEHTWPASWMLALEENGGASLPWVDRALSHIKVSVSSDGQLSAKAYVSARQEWEPHPAPPERPEASSREHGECVDAAVMFLLGKRLQNGWWTEFHTLLGPSDEWTTAFVGVALAGCASEQAQQAAGEAAGHLLSRQRQDGGWGYNADCPSDADTTAWVLKLFARLSHSAEAQRKGLAFLQRHRSPDGAVATYRRDASLVFAGDDPLSSAKGWQGGHLCVSANAAALLDERWADSLAEQQDREGYWQPYWWKTPALATGLACELLKEYPKHEERLLRAAVWAERFEPGTRSAFVESWLIRVLLCGSREQRSTGCSRAAALRAQQRPDGSWENGADLRIPAADDVAGSTAPEVLYERRNVFTTASVLASLSLAAAAAQEDHSP